MDVIFWSNSTREELAALLPESLVVLPTGATEQHGQHLVTGHDTIIVTHIAEQAAARADVDQPIVLCPTLPFGSSHHHLPFGGTLSLSTTAYYHAVRDLLESMVAARAKRMFILNGHGGNHELNEVVVRDVALAQSDTFPIAAAAASYWDIAKSSLISDATLANMPLPGHAGRFETSTMLSMAEAFVRATVPTRAEELSPALELPGTRVEFTGQWSTFEGYTDEPDKATPELGERILDHVIRDVADVLSTFSRIPLARQP